MNIGNGYRDSHAYKKLLAMNNDPTHLGKFIVYNKTNRLQEVIIVPSVMCIV